MPDIQEAFADGRDNYPERMHDMLQRDSFGCTEKIQAGKTGRIQQYMQVISWKKKK